MKDMIVTDKIEATDSDTDAQLKFSIDWEMSYATKPGSRVEPESYRGCFVIEEREINRNNVTGILRVNTSFEHDIDYEKFEVVYLWITVEDINQEIMPNTATALLVVQIIDVNDNPPAFVGNTLTVSRRVIEETETDVLVGSIIAIDIDGPDNNVIEYSLL